MNTFPEILPFSETRHSVYLRTEMEKFLKYGAYIKGSDPSHFNAREGYNESFLDSLPLIREINDYAPPR